MGGVPFTGFAGPNGGLPYIPLPARVHILCHAGSRHDIPSVERQNIYQILDNVTKIHGSHSFKFGFELESIRTSFAQSQYPRGIYNFNGQYTQKLHAIPATSETPEQAWPTAVDRQHGQHAGLSPGWNTSYYRNYRAAYFQDDWRVNSKLTANLGVRYDYIQPDSSKAGDLANFVITSRKRKPQGAPVIMLRTVTLPARASMYCPPRLPHVAPSRRPFSELVDRQHISAPVHQRQPSLLGRRSAL